MKEPDDFHPLDFNIPQPCCLFVIANRAPTDKDNIIYEWWYDRSEKVVYRAYMDGYVKD